MSSVAGYLQTLVVSVPFNPLSSFSVKLYTWLSLDRSAARTLVGPSPSQPPRSGLAWTNNLLAVIPPVCRLYRSAYRR